jgi:SAM-dependent methyltransferase
LKGVPDQMHHGQMVTPDPERALLFAEEAGRYDHRRPSYPDELIDEVLGGSPRHLSVLDVGCGAGIASRLMAARGANVLGVELNGPMAAVAERSGIPVDLHLQLRTHTDHHAALPEGTREALFGEIGHVIDRFLAASP